MPPWVQVSPQANLTSHSRLAALRPKGSPESLQGAPSLSPRRILPSKVEGGAPLCLKMKRGTPEGRCPNSPERVTGGLTPSLLCFQILLETRAVCSFLSFIYRILLLSGLVTSITQMPSIAIPTVQAGPHPSSRQLPWAPLWFSGLLPVFHSLTFGIPHTHF